MLRFLTTVDDPSEYDIVYLSIFGIPTIDKVLGKRLKQVVKASRIAFCVRKLGDLSLDQFIFGIRRLFLVSPF